MSIPHSFENTVRIHDKAIYDWLGGLCVDYDGGALAHPDFAETASWPNKKNFPVLRVMATRQRAFATVVDMLVAMGWIDGVETADKIRAADDFGVLPLPVVTFERGDPVHDALTASVPKRFRRSMFNQDTGLWENHAWPGTYLVPYNITFWSIKRYTEAFMREWIYCQLGQLGAGDREVMLTVAHAPPWGNQTQALMLDGTSDLSDLEGENPRYIRFEANFQLRFLHMRPISGEPGSIAEQLGTAGYFNAIQTPCSFATDVGADVHDDALATIDIPSNPSTSFNLFEPFYTKDSDVTAQWPRAGAGTIERSTIAPPGVPVGSVYKAHVRAVVDQIGIVEKPVCIEDPPNDRALLSFAIRYCSTAEVTIRIDSKTGTTGAWNTVRKIVLPAASTWTEFQVFTLAEESIISVVLEGRAIDADFWFTDADLRHVFNATQILETTNVPGFGGGTKHVWSGLDRPQSYMLVVVPDTPTGVHAMRTEDDDVAPAHIIERTFDATVEPGFVELIQPANGSVAVTVPAGFPSATYYIQPYIGGFRGRLVA